MHYNPPGNDVHEMAKQLDDFFASRWKELEAKWGQAAPAALHKTVSGGVLKKGVPALKSDLKNDLGKLSGKRNLPHLCADLATSCTNDSPTLDSCRGGKHVKFSGSGGARETSRVASCRIVIRSRHKNSSHVLADYSTEKTTEFLFIVPQIVCRVTVQLKNLKRIKSHLTDPDSEGVVSAEGGKSWLTSSPVAPNSLPVEGDDYSCDQQLSPKKALRAAMLKKRFADTILKAQQKMLLENGKKSDPVQVKDQLEKKKREEKARLLAQFKAAEAEARRKVEAEAKLQREREREAARITLQKMVKTVDIDENLSILEDILMFGYPSSPVDAINGHERRSPLEEIGLYLKEDWY
ncbi:Transcription factor GTE12 [Acorus calamus]|uniref:Transcription factor GTE12 n=1 Tax=Acorus calamus TaxID=4465 RepID=A0AAV9C1B1_ACOCL|nr:Transcription factor GTE12 [Acorus calamus]